MALQLFIVLQCRVVIYGSEKEQQLFIYINTGIGKLAF